MERRKFLRDVAAASVGFMAGNSLPAMDFGDGGKCALPVEGAVLPGLDGQGFKIKLDKSWFVQGDCDGIEWLDCGSYMIWRKSVPDEDGWIVANYGYVSK